MYINNEGKRFNEEKIFIEESHSIESNFAKSPKLFVKVCFNE